MKAAMAEHVAARRHTMFRDSCHAVRQRLREMLRGTEQIVADRADEAYAAIAGDYRGAFGDAPLAPGQVVPKWQREMRHDVRQVLRSAEPVFRGVEGVPEDAALMGKMDLGPAPKAEPEPEPEVKDEPVSTGGAEPPMDGASTDAPHPPNNRSEAFNDYIKQENPPPPVPAGLIDLTGDDTAGPPSLAPPSSHSPATSTGSGSDDSGLGGGDDDHGDIGKFDPYG